MVIKIEEAFSQAENESENRIKLAATIRPGSHVHFIGICGSGMAQAAVLMKNLGYKVTGSDKAFYPPMGDVVKTTAEQIYEGYSPENLNGKPDLVVIGNNVSRNNPEAEFVLAEKLSYCSMPELFAAFLIRGRDFCSTSIVVSGTHGKTTTSCAIATFFDVAGFQPGYFVGGAPLNLPSGIREINTNIPLSKRVVVLEGDEYDSAFFAKWAKFHSYRPDILVVTSLEFDHADIYDSIEEIELEFDRVARKVPSSGTILIWDGDQRLQDLAQRWRQNPKISASVLLYGESKEANFRLLSRVPSNLGQRLEVSLAGESLTLTTPLTGLHNALNLLVTASVCALKNIPGEDIKKAASIFQGVKRRQQILIEHAGVCVIEDFAHHPTAVDLTLKGLKERFPGRRLVAVFEPRSNTSKQAFFQKEFTNSFSAADVVIIQEVTEIVGYVKDGKEKSQLNVAAIIEGLAKNGKKAQSFTTPQQILETLKNEIRPGDVVVIMSNGDFGGIMRDLTKEIKSR